MKRSLPHRLLALFIIIISATSLSCARKHTLGQSRESSTDPLNATYTIEKEQIRLFNGRREVQAAPGSATKVTTAVFGDPLYEDVDGDGDADAVLFLAHDPGGSGTFFYVAAALNKDGGYQGTNAVLIGDRTTPRSVAMRNGVIVVSYTDRRPEDPMAAAPSVRKSMYLILESGRLTETIPIDEKNQVIEGWVTIGHEVRSFAPCSQKQVLWLKGDSQALKEIVAAYRTALPDPKPYTPLFMTLSGRISGPPADGFGAEYEAAFSAERLIRVRPGGNCKSELIYLESPLPGALVASPLKIRGYARGFWFFEGDVPIVLTDANGKVIARHFCTAKGEWMTREFVRFEGSVEFEKPGSGERGTLILLKDNPTGLPDFDDALEVPVIFK